MRVIDLLWFLIPVGMMFLGNYFIIRNAMDQCEMNKELSDELEKELMGKSNEKTTH